MISKEKIVETTPTTLKLTKWNGISLWKNNIQNHSSHSYLVIIKNSILNYGNKRPNQARTKQLLNYNKIGSIALLLFNDIIAFTRNYLRNNDDVLNNTLDEQLKPFDARKEEICTKYGPY